MRGLGIPIFAVLLFVCLLFVPVDPARAQQPPRLVRAAENAVVNSVQRVRSRVANTVHRFRCRSRQ